MSATIKKDHLDGTDTGRVIDIPIRDWDDGKTHTFKLVDDDGVTYYTGSFVGDELSLFEWGAAYAGTTELHVDGELSIG